MALAFGPDEARLPPSSRSRFAEARPLQCSNLLQSSTRSTLGLVIHAAGSNFEWPRFSKGRLPLSLSHHKVILPSLLSCKTDVPDLQQGTLERASSVATNARWGKKIFRKGDPASQGARYGVAHVRAYTHGVPSTVWSTPCSSFLNFSTRSSPACRHRCYCINKVTPCFASEILC